MKLRRPVWTRVIMLVLGAGMLWFAGFLMSLQRSGGGSVSGRIFAGLFTLAALFAAVVSFWYAFQRFRVDVDQDGWTVQIGGYRCEPRWPDISAVVIQNRETPYQNRKRIDHGFYLVLEPGVSPDTPTDRRATVDGRPAVWLFDMDDHKKRFVRDLAGLAGDRLDVRVYPLGFEVLTGEFRERVNRDADEWLKGRSLPAFPSGAAGVRTQRWLNRRRFTLFVGWYLFAVLPALLLTRVAAGVDGLLGAAVMVLGVVAVVAAYGRFVAMFRSAIDLLEQKYTIFGTELVRGLGSPNTRDDLHGGRAVVLPPGTERGYGKAWLLGFPHPVALLGDPRTGRLRDDDDLRILSALLRESPHETDRIAARDIDNLAEQSRAAEPMAVETGDAGNADLGVRLTKAGRVLAWAVVVGSIVLAAGWIGESAHLLGSVMVYLSVPLIVLWAFYALVRICTLVSGVWKAIRN